MMRGNPKVRMAVVCGLVVLGASACGGGGGSTSVTSDSLVNGTYCLFAFNGDPSGPTARVLWGDLVADGAGLFTGGTYSENDAGVIDGPLPSGSLEYSVGSGGSIDWQLGGPSLALGGVSADGVVQAVNSVTGDPGVFLLLKKAGSYTTSTLSGTYGMYLFSHDGGTFRTFFGSAAFDGAGGVDYSFGINSSGAINTGIVFNETYGVSGTGDMSGSFGASTVSGAIRAGGDVVFLSGSTTASNFQVLGVLIRDGAGLTDATLNGTYHLVSIDSDAGGGFDWRSFSATVSFDGAGMVALGAGVENEDGAVVATPAEPAVSYAVAANGRWTVGDLTGSVSQDGSVAALAGGTAGGDDPSFIVIFK